MGNSLCKERIARADNSKSPIDRIIGRCAQICPAGEGKNPNFWQKHVLETCPPTNTQPKATMEGWHRATLTVPTAIKTTDENGKEVPIPPPRRKRLSQEAHPIEKPKSGFKELFGHNISRRSSCDSAMHVERVASADKEKLEAQQRRTQSAANLMPAETLAKLHIEPRPVVVIPQAPVQSSTTPSPDHSALQRKVSRVGNKKSDKFFGENLSDCLSDELIVSDPPQEPIHQASVGVGPSAATATAAVATKDDIDIFIERNIPQHNAEDIVKSATIEPSTISITDDIVIQAVAKTGSEANAATSDTDEVVHMKRDSLDKKAEFLMAMLDDDKLYKEANDDASTTTGETVVAVVAAPRRKHSKQQEADKENAETVESAVEKQITTNVRAAVPQTSVDDADYYKGRAPVEEPIIVPKHRHYGHICDEDHDHSVHESAQGHDEPDTRPPVNIEAQIIPAAAEVSSTTASIVASAPIACPKKPKRDFALYEKSKQSTGSSSSSPEEPKPIKRTSRKKQRPSSTENLLSDVSHTKTEKIGTVNPVPERRRLVRADEKLDSKLIKCKSSSSFLTQEMMNQIVERVYGFQDPYAEDHGYDDYSTKVTPNSKLTTRKISTTKREVPAIEEDLREYENKKKTALPSEKVEINEKVVTKSMGIAGPEEEITMDRRREIERALKDNVQHKKSKQETLSFIELEKLHAHPGHKRVPHTETIHAFSQPHITEDIEKILSTINPDEEAISHVLDDIYKTNSSILDEFQKYLNEGISDDQDSDDKPLTDDGGQNDDDHVHAIVKKDAPHFPVETITTTHTTTVGQLQSVTVAYEIEDGVRKPLFVNVNGERRDSIVDVDQWFLKHNEFGDHPRRGSESGISAGYNTKKLFPFGKLDKGSKGATEFFETKSQSKSQENLAGDQPKAADEHSTLLKYMK